MSMFTDTSYEAKVDIPYGQLKDVISWCSDNCSGDWRYSIIDNAGSFPGIYQFKFEDESDLITFLLRIK